MMSPSGSPFRILTVCTGNICRSPAAERLLRRALADSPAEQPIEVGSAGVHAVVGHPIQEQMAALLQADGVNAGGFEARQLTPDLVRSADLVLAADRTHRESVLRLVPAALRRTFMMKEFVRLATQLPSNDGPATMDDRLRWLIVQVPMMRGRNLVPEGADDIIDPFGGTPGDYRAAYLDVRKAVAALAGD